MRGKVAGVAGGGRSEAGDNVREEAGCGMVSAQRRFAARSREMGMDSLERMAADWNASDFCRSFSVEILELSPGASRAALHVEERHRRHRLIPSISGGSIAYFFDAVLGAAVSTVCGEDVRDILTVELQIQFLRPLIARRRATAAGFVVRKGRNLVFVRGEAFDEAGKLSSTATGIWALIRGGARTLVSEERA
ncbi:hypothetical protein MAMC_00488 [Methylacidimicrobium cyclopophantes]|uniref:Thioesterase domain-containing protein n=1 Tax=Methylacidimicrobium cyclopophantes TaxID=1041766 RepID=A0A5E6M7G7_9BACT|nr:PaaI family thioesterase [Methylacidimicrobium cyclopophantes]VVM05256.1 hypothetical protein MAMC_00488 [Methylacidimicrobium cyclopophantes]